MSIVIIFFDNEHYLFVNNEHADYADPYLFVVVELAGVVLGYLLVNGFRHARQPDSICTLAKL